MPPEAKEVKPAKISITHVSKLYLSGMKTEALHDVTFDVAEGEFVCLVGSSGCGKSTLLNMLAGLDFPTQGQIYFDNLPIEGPASDRVLILQEAALFPWLTVLDNVLFGLKLKSEIKANEKIDIAMTYLAQVGLEKFKHSPVHELSGGMKSRLALVRGLAVDPKVLLMDEPFSSLDALTREQIYEDIQWLWETHKKTIVFVTHNVSEAVCLGNRVILFSPSPGKNMAEFKIHLPRSRDIRSLEVAQYTQDIIGELRRIIAYKQHKDAK